MVFDVKSPILGFENVTKMKLEKIDDLFMKLYNVDGEVPHFTLVNPFLLREYEFDVPSSIKILLDLENAKNLLIANIMVIQKPIENSIVNLIAPFVFNPANGFCLQVTTLPVAQYPQFSKVQPLKEFLSNEILQTLNQ